MDTSFDISINISVSIPIIGDSSIMLAQPPAGFEFKEIRIDEYIYRNRITDSRGEVMPEYNNKSLCAGICGRTGQHKGQCSC